MPLEDQKLWILFVRSAVSSGKIQISQLTFITQHSKQSTWTNMKLTSFAPGEFSSGSQLESIERYVHKNSNIFALLD